MPRPRLDSLEPRKLFAVSLDNGILNIVGTSAADVLRIDQRNASGTTSPFDQRVIVTLNGQEHTFAARDVARIDVRTGGGNDTVRLFDDDTRFPRTPFTTVDAGAGEDLLVLGPRAANNSIIRGGAGFDLLVSHGSFSSPALPSDDASIHIRPDGLVTVRGSNNNDILRVADDGPTKVRVTANILTYTFARPSRARLVVDGRAGHDTITTRGDRPEVSVSTATPFADFTLPATLLGGAGDDTLFAGPRTTHLYGDTGNDALHTARATKLAHGGKGTDTLHTSPTHRATRKSIETIITT